MRLNDKVAIVTGASSGLGHAMTLRFETMRGLRFAHGQFGGQRVALRADLVYLRD